MSQAYALTLAVISLSLVGALAALCTNSFTSAILRNCGVWIIAAIVLAGVMKYPHDGQIFSGLEYEDAYVYGAAARSNITSAPRSSSHPFLTDSCSYGSLVECNGHSTYSGHVIGYSAVIAGAAKLVGFDPWLANYVSLVASVLCAGIVFVTAMLISKSVPYASLAAFIFALLPFQNLFSTASVVEPFSSLFLALSLLGYLVCVHCQSPQSDMWRRYLSWSALALVWWASILVKRENALAIALLPVVTVGLLLAERQPLRAIASRLLPAFCISIALACFSIAAIDISETVEAEASDVGGFPFSFAYLPKLLPAFVATLLDWRLFAFLSALLPLALVRLVPVTKQSLLVLYPVILFCGYVLLYSLHYRSYYFIRTGEVAEFDAYRYLANVIPLYSLIVAAGLHFSWEAFQKVAKLRPGIARLIAFCGAGLAIGFSAVQTSNLRDYYRDIENNVRLDAVLAVLGFVQSGSHPYIVVTDDVLLFQLLGPNSMFLIDLHAVSKVSDLFKLAQHRTLYYVKKPHHDEAIERNRFAKEFDILAGFNMEKRYEDSRGRFTIYALNP